MPFRAYESRGFTIEVEQPEQSRYEFEVISPTGATLETLESTNLVNGRIRCERCIDDALDESESPKVARLLYFSDALENAESRDDVASAFEQFSDVAPDVAESSEHANVDAMKAHWSARFEDEEDEQPDENFVVLDVDDSEGGDETEDESADVKLPSFDEEGFRKYLDNTLTVDDLKDWLKERDLPVGGRKDELITRVIKRIEAASARELLDWQLTDDK